MRTKITAYYDPKRDEIWFGLKVLCGDVWARVAENGNALLFKSEAKAHAARNKYRAMKYKSK